MTPRKDDRGGMGKRRNVSDDGWSQAPSRNRAGGGSSNSFTIQSDKLKNKVVSVLCFITGIVSYWGFGSIFSTAIS